MEKSKFTKKWLRRLSFRGLSIQQRLPLLIFILLFSVILTFSWISWIGVRNAAIRIGEERLLGLTEQLSNLFGQSAQTIVAASQATAKEEAIKKYLTSDGKEQRSEALDLLQKLAPDKATILVALLDKDGRYVLHINKDSLLSVSSFDTLLLLPFLKTDSSRVRKIYPVKDSMYYPVIVPVIDDKNTIGYIVKWRLQYATPKAIEQFAQLLGTDATMYIGNADGSLWTDLARPMRKFPINPENKKRFFDYKNLQGKPVIAAAHIIPHTSWIVLVEFSKKKILESSNRFLRWVLLAGTILIAIGLIITWIISRNITRPLKKLTAAASAIAGGDYSLAVETNRRDELGKLARSFNAMTTQVHQSQQNLENKVQDRTVQLEMLNKELEAFSYSISHDLRAPLRIIDGYTDMLLTDYPGKFDKEGNRIMGVIKNSAQRMGQLIDDLLDFAQIGRKELLQHKPNMQALVTSVLEELLPYDRSHISLTVTQLEDAECDSSLIRQVWINLLGNAIKYSAKNQQPSIEISCRKNEQEIIYSIKDNGVGFDMKYADKLFGVFQRLHKTTDFEGTGIGLALAKRIVTRHGGKIWGEAEKGKGAAFYFSLPVQSISTPKHFAPMA